jgi:polygalacturonase
MHGRELTTIRKATIFSDRPIVIEKNLSKGPESFIDCDHLHMQDLYLGSDAPSAACLFIASGVALTNFVLDGTNAFLLAKYGIYWDDTLTRYAGANMSIKNVRVEQKKEMNGYAVYISHNHALQNLIIENVMASPNNNGFYLRKCRWVSIINCFITTPTWEALNVDNCDDVAIINTLFQAGSKANLTGLVEKFSTSKTYSASPLPATGFYVRDRRK